MADLVYVNATVDLQIQLMERKNGILKPLDVSALTCTFTFSLAPTRFTRTASNLNTGTDGWVHYTTTTTDLSAPGEWQIQPIASGAGTNYPGTPVVLNVQANL